MSNNDETATATGTASCGVSFSAGSAPELDGATLERYATWFKALSNPHRLRLYLRLVALCPPKADGSSSCCDGVTSMQCCVGDLAAGLDIAPSTVSHHLKELRTAGLLRTERQGREILCWIEPGVQTALKQFLGT